MQALKNRVIVKEDAPIEKIGSIFVPYQIKPQMPCLAFTGVIVSAGKDVIAPLKSGTRILFSRFSPMEIAENKYLCMTEDDVQAIIED